MLSESARVTTAEEARFRIDRPNSRPRSVTIVALDRAAEGQLAALGAAFPHASCFPAVELAHGGRLGEVVAGSDVVVMLATAGAEAPEVPIIGRVCSDRRVTTTGLVVCPPEVPADLLSHSLTQLRPWMLMLVVASDVEYVEDMLRALRA